MQQTGPFTMVTSRAGYYPGSVNVGVIRSETGLILIDSGLDAQTARKIKRAVEAVSLPLRAIVQTHAHADHFGGNAHLLAVWPEARVYAPPLEEAVMRYPLLEPIYLGMGAVPLAELKNKFLFAEPSRVDHLLPDEGEVIIDGVPLTILPLPGHSWNQVGIVADNICYAADSYFGLETLAKHKVPFLVDVDETLNSLNRLLETDFAGYLPGHGPFERSARETIRRNIEWHHALMDVIQSILAEAELTLEEALAVLCEREGIAIDNATSFVLYRTALMGYFTGMWRRQRVRYRFQDNRMWWSAGAGEP